MSRCLMVLTVLGVALTAYFVGKRTAYATDGCWIFDGQSSQKGCSSCSDWLCPFCQNNECSRAWRQCQRLNSFHNVSPPNGYSLRPIERPCYIEFVCSPVIPCAGHACYMSAVEWTYSTASFTDYEYDESCAE